MLDRGEAVLGRVALALDARQAWVLWQREDGAGQSLWLSRRSPDLATEYERIEVARPQGKGRATGGVRCHRFLKGEDTLLLAWAGPAPAWAAAASGAPVELPDADGRRDGSGVPAGQPIAAVSSPSR